MPLSKRKIGADASVALPAGAVNRVQLSPYRLALAGVQTAPVEYQRLAKQIEAVGYVEFDERGQRTVSARTAGRIDKLLVNETGRMVKEGEELASLYSPDLIEAIGELQEASRARSRKDTASAWRKLETMGVGQFNGQRLTHLTIRSPINGHVIKKNVREGQYVEQGMPLFEIVDLSTVWIQAQVYEDDLQFLPSNQTHQRLAPADRLSVVATTRAFPDQPFQGTLAFIYPHVDQQTRTVSVRIELKNPEHRLRPGSTATVTINVTPQKLPMFARVAAAGGEPANRLAQGEVLAVPETAVIDTGRQTIVYREATPGVFEGTQVKLGPRMVGPHETNWLPVLSGLSAGDQIVASGSFLVDAETRLNPAAGSIYFGGGSKSAGGPVRPSTPEPTTISASEATAADPAAEATIAANLAKLSAADRAVAEQQRFCAVLASSRLGSMGVPIKLMVDSQPVFICCPGCRERALAEDANTVLEKVAKLKAQTAADHHD
jgi:Cu(I)/Ag(I) efflux system membrane fusion protein